MSNRVPFLAAVLTVVAMVGCGRNPSVEQETPQQLAKVEWPDIVARAKGTGVTMAMWAGDEARNRFFQGPVTRTVAADLGVTLRIVPVADAADVVNKLMTEKSVASEARGSIDVVWINGENFRAARQADVLWGPLADLVPNRRTYDADAGTRDFGTPTDGFEVPWEYSQFVFAYDSARMKDPPRTLDELRQWIARHPGRFTYPAIPDFTGSAFIRHVLLHAASVSPEVFAEGFDERLYARASQAALNVLREMRPNLWRRGETYPATPAELNRLFVNGEVDFSMSYGPTFASERIARGEFPPTVRTFALEEGTIANYNFLAIPFNAPNPAGALAVIDALLSPAHALAKIEAIGGMLPHALASLSEDERRKYDALPRGAATLPLDVLSARRVAEADVEYLIRLERDWRRTVLQP